ncbi:MAG: LL-diaminopimelate aminotransferase [Chlamydiae bacterium]|nr:LL-diaminopimelate aminotransferase [Chlamydiota bacterium]
MVAKNLNFSKLKSSYLFIQIEQKKTEFLEKNPGVELINLGIGDTSSPIPQFISEKLAAAAIDLGTVTGYSGYGSSAGNPQLRKRISEVLYPNLVDGDEVFVSDGSKCDIGRLQILFGRDVTIAVQDPTYPVYVDGTLLQGATDEIVKMSCTPENHFFPDLSSLPRTDLIYFCSPNNPTGSVATKEQLKQLVDFAKQNQSIIIFDSAYAGFIQDPQLPRSIYEIEGADEVAIETGSFSKLAGFTGVRLGWTIVPQKLKYSDGSSIRDTWIRTISTIYNGPSNIAQAGGLAVLEPEGQRSVKRLIEQYMSGAQKLAVSLKQSGFVVYGGENAPYLWVRCEDKNSWDSFHELLEKSHIVSTPGAGFGMAGEGFIRFSAFATADDIEKAIEALAN